MILLAKNCRPVLVAMLTLAGHDLAVIGVELETVELHLGDMMASVQSLREARH